MRRLSTVLFFALATTIPGIAADADAAKSAIDAARKAAGDAGIELPEIKQSDLDKLIKKAAKEVAKVREGEEKSGDAGDGGKDKPDAGGDKNALPSIRIEKLPAWIPEIPGFKPAGLGREWQGADFVTGKLKGTSASSPDDLAAEWEDLDGPVFSAERTTRKADGKTRETVRLTKPGVPNHWAEMSAEPGEAGQPTAVRVTYSKPVPPGKQPEAGKETNATPDKDNAEVKKDAAAPAPAPAAKPAE